MLRKLQLSVVALSVIALMAGGELPAQQPEVSPKATAKGGSAGNVEILSDTKGVDFRPYLDKQMPKIKANWFKFIPQEARPPQLMSGETAIEFSILRDGNVAGMKIVHGSGTISLDRAAWGALTSSNPFDPLPQEFTGTYLALRIHFLYNPNKKNANNETAPVQPESKDPVASPH